MSCHFKAFTFGNPETMLVAVDLADISLSKMQSPIPAAEPHSVSQDTRSRYGSDAQQQSSRSNNWFPVPKCITSARCITSTRIGTCNARSRTVKYGYISGLMGEGDNVLGIRAKVRTTDGFVRPGGTALTSRTIMLAELRNLFAQIPADAPPAEYRRAIVDENLLSKPTLSTRKETFSRLRQLYGLDTELTLFRILRLLWTYDDAQPLLAGLCALARDRLLRATATVMLERMSGDILTSAVLAQAVEQVYPGNYNGTTCSAIGRHALSSWQQTGHLTTTKEKHRILVQSTPAVLTYALLLGYLEGGRGEALFATPWTHLLDTTTSLLHDQAQVASRRGLLTFRHAGGVVDVDFRLLLTTKEHAHL